MSSGSQGQNQLLGILVIAPPLLALCLKWLLSKWLAQPLGCLTPVSLLGYSSDGWHSHWGVLRLSLSWAPLLSCWSGLSRNFPICSIREMLSIVQLKMTHLLSSPECAYSLLWDLKSHSLFFFMSWVLHGWLMTTCIFLKTFFSMKTSRTFYWSLQIWKITWIVPLSLFSRCLSRSHSFHAYAPFLNHHFHNRCIYQRCVSFSAGIAYF